MLTTVLAGCMPPSWGAGALLHPQRKAVVDDQRRPHETLDLMAAGVRVKGWRFRGEGTRRGTIIYLHGAGDNRGSSGSIADHFVPGGFDVVAYDSRAHGESGGAACTYGYYEKADLGRVLDQIAVPAPIIALGMSLGGAVALQAAATDARIAAVIAIAPFSDLRTVASERAPFFASKGNIDDAFRIAEAEAHFQADDVSPVVAARKITAPVLIIHGDDDRETPPAHARRIFDALPNTKKLVLVPHAGHHNVLNAATWSEIDAWIATVAAPRSL
ncbi:MAG TPA: alpha/beta fold hydrolase [Polyangia bacterium]|nr:alpha/beta fold hydrolase [Polyangia bacterium]